MKRLLVVVALLSVSASGQNGVSHAVSSGSAFQQLAEVMGAQAGDAFGEAVAISGKTVVVGAPGASCNAQANCGVAYVFTKTNGNWGDLTQVATLTQTNAILNGEFGYAVAISGNTIVVSGFDAALAQNVVYVFVEPARAVGRT